MRRTAAALLTLALCIALSACHGRRPNLAPRPEALGFPLVEESALPFAGTANGPVRARYGVAYFSTAEGSLYSVDVLSRRILWRFQADRPLPAAPELGQDSILVRDDGNTIHVLNPDGRLIFKTTPTYTVTTPVRESKGRLYFGCANGRIVALDVTKKAQSLWEFNAGAAVRSGPVFSGNLAIFGTDDGRIIALDQNGRMVWTFAAKGPVRVDPTASEGGVYFGTAERYFYGLKAETGKKKWVFHLAGTPLHPPAVSGKRVVFSVSDSVVYCLNARSGEILWWQAVPARIVHGPSIADGVVLVSALSPEVAGYDLRGGYRVGSYRAPADIVTGAQWVTPYLFIIEPEPAPPGERIVFLKRDRRPVQNLGETNPIRR